MQENRAFDHYFGKMRGVRGFNDRSAPPLPDGRKQFHQPLGNATKIQECRGYGCSNEQQGGHCLPGMPGSKNKTYTCCYLKWVKGNSCSTPFPPPATSCEGATTLQECQIQNQTCTKGTKGAGPNGNRCCGGWWNDNLETPCPPPPPPAEYMLPYHVNLSATSGECMVAPEMDYRADIKIWNNGLMDKWNMARIPGYGMAHFDRSDLPYYYALADAFTVGDQHFQSTFTQTCPNRMHLFSGSNNNLWNREARGSKNSTFMMLNNTEPTPGFDWPTMAETLEDAGVSWKVYMETDNFDDNGFAWFANFQNATQGDPLYEKGLKRVPTNDLVPSFEADVKNGVLPQVSWLIAPANQSEHATNHPAAGEDLSARLLRVLQKNPEVYKKTAFILNYDEGGQFFDHAVPPTPNTNDGDGKSTIVTDGEITTESQETIPKGNPIGLGFRVPLIIVSPWTREKGGAVYSEVVDHTSIIQFIEKRFDVKCPNISPWRRSITGDLTAAFDFDSAPDYTWPLLPDTSDYVKNADQECATKPSPVVPRVQKLPVQENGTKKARALPYKFVVEDSISDDGQSITLSMKNLGLTGVVFLVYDYASVRKTIDGITMDPPKKYTIEPNKQLSAQWQKMDNNAGFNLQLYGPNGFVRKYQGSVSPSSAAFMNSIQMVEDPAGQNIQFNFAQLQMESNNKACQVSSEVIDNAYDLGGPWKVDHSMKRNTSINVAPSGNWYDFSVSFVSSCTTNGGSFSATYTKMFMGKMETGKPTITDPAMARSSDKVDTEHPDVPQYWRFFNKTVNVGERARRAMLSLRQRGAHSMYIGNKCAADKDSCVYV